MPALRSSDSLRCFPLRLRHAVAAGILLGTLPWSAVPTTAHADILRQNVQRQNAARNAQARQQAGAEAAAAAHQVSQDRLRQTTQALQAMKSAQAAARAAASAAAGVTDGLSANGLQVDTVTPRWDGAFAPKEFGSPWGTTVVIKQKEQRAVLHWKKFNVGRGTILRFDQSDGGEDASKWTAFNKVNDPTGNPSKILGRIEAPGHVYILNRNGILFGAGSQVNVRGLVASTLPINDNLIQKGLLNNRDAQFLFSTLSVPGGSDGTPDFLPPPGRRPGSVVVERGAFLESPAGSAGNGGRIILAAPRVVNDGWISTPSGQTILAAGDQVAFHPHRGDDPSLRGLDVWIGAASPDSGFVENSGIIEAPTGSILLAGKSIRNRGIIESSTSVNLNGRVDILASYGAVANPNFDNPSLTGGGGSPFLSQFTGNVEFLPNSIVRILPEYSQDATAPGTRLPQSSQIFIEGREFHFRSGSKLLAPSAKVSVRAGTWAYKDGGNNRTVFDASGEVEDGLASNFVGSAQRFFFNGGLVRFEPGSLLDVSGTKAAVVPSEHNIMRVQFRGAELAESPLQRNTSVRGQDLLIDLRKSGVYNGRYWVGTPLGDATGLAGLIQRNVSQLTTSGGSLEISSGDLIQIAPGATMDVSGGYSVHQGGRVQTTRLLRGNQIIDISNATPDRVYDGIYTGTTRELNLKWGVSREYAHPLAPLGAYNARDTIYGAPGGSISLQAPRIQNQGNLIGRTITGPLQMSNPTAHSTISFAFFNEKQLKVSSTDIQFLKQSPHSPLVEIRGDFRFAKGTGTGFLGSGARSSFVIEKSLYDAKAGGFGKIQVENPEGPFVLAENQSVKLQPGGSLVVSSSNAFIGGELQIPGGNVEIRSFNFSPYRYEELSASGRLLNRPAPGVVAGKGVIMVGESGVVDVSGMRIDDRPTFPGNAVAGRRAIDGGTVTLEGYHVLLRRGSIVDASGGLQVSYTGKYQPGSGGKIALLAGRDPALSTSVGGTLSLGGEVRAFGVRKGGELSLRSTRIVVAEEAGGTEGVLSLRPSFFQQGGFGKYLITGIGDNTKDGSRLPAVSIAPGTFIEPHAKTWRITAYERKTGTFSLSPMLLAEGIRPPASVEFRGLGSDDPFTESRVERLGWVEMGTRSVLRTDAGASVSLAGDAVTVRGAIFAPGGSIVVSGGNRFRMGPAEELLATSALPTVHLDSSAVLSAAGKFVPFPDPFGRRTGLVFPGGSIRVSGNIVAEAGALLDVSGTHAFLDIPAHLAKPARQASTKDNDPRWIAGPPVSLRTKSVRVDSAGGLIELRGGQMLYSDATLLGKSGGPTAPGGLLSISSGRYYPPNTLRRSSDINLLVQKGRSVLSDLRGEIAIGSQLVRSNGSPLPGIGRFSMERFSKGGFDSLDLGYEFFSDASPVAFGGNVQFLEGMDIRARGTLRVAGGGIIQSTSAVTLRAPYIAIGHQPRLAPHPEDAYRPFQKSDPANPGNELSVVPTFGSGSLFAEAELIDVGTLVTRGIGSMTLSTPGGDIRGAGVLNTRGKLVLSAAQVYPATASDFSIFVFDPPGSKGSLRVEKAGFSAAPLSAGGSLRLFASHIVQNGVLHAPFGSIEIGWDGKDINPASAAMDRPANPVTLDKIPAPVASTVVIGSASRTSVSGLDAQGRPLIVPYGTSPDGLTWIDPRGVNVTTKGLPEKTVLISGGSVLTSPGSEIDLRGGGDLVAFRWVAGSGGSADLLGTTTRNWNSATSYKSGDLVRSDGKLWSARVAIDPMNFATSPRPGNNSFWLEVTESYAILPGFSSKFAPLGAFNTKESAVALGGELGFVNPALRPGDQVHLDASIPGLPAGKHTLLPARYAVLPGAFLVQPKGTSGKGIAFVNEEGVHSLSGTRRSLSTSGGELPLRREFFEVLPPEVHSNRAKYETYFATDFIKTVAERLELKEIQALPSDAGYLGISGSRRLRLDGSVLTARPEGGRGAWVDIASDAPISLGAGQPSRGSLLSPSRISSWGAESIVIGGRRYSSDGVWKVDVRTPEIRVGARAGELHAPDITLAAKQRLEILPGAIIRASPSADSRPPAPLVIDGAGAALRVSSKSGGGEILQRVVKNQPASPILHIHSGAVLEAPVASLNSSKRFLLENGSQIAASDLTLAAGQISVDFNSFSAPLAGEILPQHLVITPQTLAELSLADSLRLHSYTTIDFYGDGNLSAKEKIELKSYSIRSPDRAGSNIIIRSENVSFGNPSGERSFSSRGISIHAGKLQVQAASVDFLGGDIGLDGFDSVQLNAGHGIFARGSGSLQAPDALVIRAPGIAVERAKNFSFRSEGKLDLISQNPTTRPLISGLGGSLEFVGSSVLSGIPLSLPSGVIRITATRGDLDQRAGLEARGSSIQVFDVNRFFDAGRVLLSAERGSVALAAGSQIDVSGLNGNSNAGLVSISAPSGVVVFNGALEGHGYTGSSGGSFLLDAKSIPSFSEVNSVLEGGGFSNLRDMRLRDGDLTINDAIRASNIRISLDRGNLIVNSVLDASGVTGGTISLAASGDLRLGGSSLLSVKAQKFNAAGKGGSVFLSAGAPVDGVANTSSKLQLEPGSTILLGVEEFRPGSYSEPGSSAFHGQFQGTLHLRAPRVGADAGVGDFGAKIEGASKVVLEALQLYSPSSPGVLDTALRGRIHSDSTAFMNAAETPVLARLLAGRSDAGTLAPLLFLAPGVEIFSKVSDLSLGRAGDLHTSDWDLSSFRYGTRGVPGFLTIRSPGNLLFNNSLSDGFVPVAATAENGHSSLWRAPLQLMNSRLPADFQSWSFKLVAGADISAANSLATLPLKNLAPNSGSIFVGEFYRPVPNDTEFGLSSAIGPDGVTANSIRISKGFFDEGTRFEVIRTGTGSIEVHSARDIQLRNVFSTIYTAGVALPDSSRIFQAGDFVVPTVQLSFFGHPDQGNLGAVQQNNPPRWAMAGGNLQFVAGNDIGRFTRFRGEIIPDVSRQIPSNWLYRRSYVDPSTGRFGAIQIQEGLSQVNDASASTTWWVDHSNFFQGFGALGGGNIFMEAGRDLVNADAMLPTSARTEGVDVSSGRNQIASAARTLEHGGGDLKISAGRNIDGGLFYVEKGLMELAAGGEIKTNFTRSPSFGILAESVFGPDSLGMVESLYPDVYHKETWLPVTLFLGKSSAKLTARGDVLAGPSLNLFLQPQGLNNKFWYKTYFSTFAPEAGVEITSLGGDIVLRNSTTLPLDTSVKPVFAAWMEKQNLFQTAGSDNFSSNWQPWARLMESSIAPFGTAATTAAPSLRVVSPFGGLKIVGSLALSPSPKADLELLVGQNIDGLTSAGKTYSEGIGAVSAWTSATLVMSDAAPNSIPGMLSPLSGYRTGLSFSDMRTTQDAIFENLALIFSETGSFTGVEAAIDRKRARHGESILHRESESPIRIYASEGDISGLTFFGPKESRIVAGRDISDVGLYLQNTSSQSVSIVSAGRDILPYSEDSPLRTLAANIALRNVLVDLPFLTSSGRLSYAASGDIQVSGPGWMEVLAGRNLDLGTGENRPDGTGVGITSIGNARNPSLPFGGASLIVAAGVSGKQSAPALGLADSSLNLEPKRPSEPSSAQLNSGELAAIHELGKFFDSIKDTGANFAETGSYEPALSNVANLVGDSVNGDVFTRSRDIRTSSGGEITILAPGGALTMASEIFGNPLTPPGIVSEYGGQVSILTSGNVDIGRARIFTLRGGDMVIWSSRGDIAAGTSPKTVVTAPPTRVVIDATSADVATDLGGLATGGGIGVLAAVKDVEPGNVFLLAPEGSVDAGDAGIQSTGSLAIAAVAVLNADNIAAGGTTAGVPSSAPPAPPPPAAPASNTSTTAAATATAEAATRESADSRPVEETPSIFQVEILGYGGGESDEGGGSQPEEEEER